MKAEFFAAAERLAAEEGCTVEIDRIWRHRADRRSTRA